MFDNLREQANSTPFYEDEAQFQEAEGFSAPRPKRSSSGKFLGMTPFQRAVIMFMIMITVCILGSMGLLVTGKIGF